MVVAATAVMHWCAVDEVAHRLQMALDSADGPTIRRMTVNFVRELAPAAAPPAPAASSRVKVARANVPRAVQPAGSSSDATKPVKPVTPDLPTVPGTQPAADALPEPADPTQSDNPSPSAMRADPDESSGVPRGEGQSPFDWPPSTRLDYTLSGQYRGPIEGSARVLWIRQGARYQVQMDVFVGPEFAALMTRKMTSDGALGEQGLMPERYHEETRVGFSTRQQQVLMGHEQVRLANGQERSRPPGAQDSASQFVQMSFLFTSQPSLLQPGQSITLPVALPRRLDQWVYDVVGEVLLPTPVGAISAFHVKPRRESPRAGELTAQAWFAPSLQYLPVRIMIHQDAETYVDLLLQSLPTQTAAPASRPELKP